MKIFKLPDLGEGLPDAEISEWHVKVGDVVHLDQNIVSMETAKAVVEVPSPIAGRVIKLYGNSGDIIKTGAPLIEFELEGTREENSRIREEKNGDAQEADAIRDNPATAAGNLEVGTQVIQQQAKIAASTLASREGNAGNAGNASNAGIKVTPAIRALAQQLQIDLSTVKPTGPNGMITRQDVEQAGQTQQSESTQRSTFSEDIGQTEPLKGVRRAMAQTMRLIHDEVVPVTVVEDAKLIHWKPNDDITVTLIQAMITACRLEPALNVWYDGKNLARRVMTEVHLGIAMDSAEGLFVPVIHSAQTLSREALRQKIDQYKREVSERSIAPQNLRGATIILSNFGKFAGRYANPVVVPPTVAILGVGQLREAPMVVKGEIRVGKLLPLSLTFDHRAVTGGEATRFLGAVIKTLEN